MPAEGVDGFAASVNVAGEVLAVDARAAQYQRGHGDVREVAGAVWLVGVDEIDESRTISRLIPQPVNPCDHRVIDDGGLRSHRSLQTALDHPPRHPRPHHR